MSNLPNHGTIITFKMRMIGDSQFAHERIYYIAIDNPDNALSKLKEHLNLHVKDNKHTFTVQKEKLSHSSMVGLGMNLGDVKQHP